MTYLLDTNIILAYLKGNEKVKKCAQRALLEGKKIFFNGVSYYEIKRGLLSVEAPAKLRELFDNFYREFGLVLLDTLDIFDIASEIYADLKSKNTLIEDADILIASVASSRKFILVTSNTRHFKRIPGLKIEDWLN